MILYQEEPESHFQIKYGLGVKLWNNQKAKVGCALQRTSKWEMTVKIITGSQQS